MRKVNTFLGMVLFNLCVLLRFGEVDLPLLTTGEKTVRGCANASLNLVCCRDGQCDGIFLHWLSWP